MCWEFLITLYYLLAWDPLRCHSCNWVLIMSFTSLCVLGRGRILDQMHSQGMGWVCYYWHIHGRHFIHSLLDLQPFGVARKTSIDSSCAGSSSQRADKCYLVLVNSKKRKVSVSYKKHYFCLQRKCPLPTCLKQEKVQQPTIIRE